MIAIDEQLVLDANALAGEMADLFGREMTAIVHRCAHCGHRGAVGSLRAWSHGPGVVLRCVICGEIVVRWVRTPGGVRVDMRGAMFMDLPL